MKLLQKVAAVGVVCIVFVAAFIFARSFPEVQQTFTQFPEGLYLSIALIFFIGFGTRKVAKKVLIPSFALAIVMGIALQPLFTSLTGNITTLSVVNQFLAALILFGSGVEMPWLSFKKYFGPVASLSFFGMLVSVLLFSLLMEFLFQLVGIVIPATSVLLLGAVMAAVDPSAIIPIFRNMKFEDRKMQDVAVAESALNDVTGTIITRFFLVVALAATTQAESVLTAFAPLFQRAIFDEFALEVIWGVVVGVIGAKVLQRWYRPDASERDNPALFFAIPIFCYALGGLVGGSGYLAAFVAGLLYQSTASTKNVVHFYDTFNTDLVVPVIFVLLGAVVPISALLQTAWIGIGASLLFMILVRPLVVFSSLVPWLFGQNRLFNFKEYIFLSIIRETGGVPAVLLLIIASQGVPGIEYIFGIGFWVILLTLLLEPPITPWVTAKLGLGKPVS